MTLPPNIETLSRSDLQLLVIELTQANTELQAAITELRAEMENMRAEVAALKRTQQRPAAPFSTGQRVANPKNSGRKPGEGTFRHRSARAEETYTTPPLEVPVRPTACPVCGGELAFEGAEVVTVTDLPAIVRPLVKAYRVQVCRCRQCGKQVRGQHPEVAPDQFGASAHRIGERAMAQAHMLHYGLGLPQRKVPAVLEQLTGLKLTQGALAQDALRRAAGCVGVAYAELRARVKDSPPVHTDDTGWRIGGESAYLQVFETEAESVYQVRPRHRNEEVREVIPSTYPGVMETDRGKSYDAKELLGVKQQKCVGHIQRSIKAVLEQKQGKARAFGNQLKSLLKEATQLWHDHHAGKVTNYTLQAAELKARISAHLRDRRLVDVDNQRLLDELGLHDDRGNLLRFLDDPQIEPTNNRAERALRPAVIARKVSQCSKNARGAEAFAAFTSVIRTLMKKRGASAVAEELCQLLRPARAPDISA
ncbi:MAG: IS66 family transposase [Acidobacteria bacterium]|nr:IS66 family transposase [Acidobacteriota bacterium]